MGILPVRLCGIGILPMIHGLEGDPQRTIPCRGPQAQATMGRHFKHLLIIALFAVAWSVCPAGAETWRADNGHGTYSHPLF